MTSLAIMQPYLFPYLGYFQLVHAVDKFIIYDDLNFIRYGWVNRNRLLAVKGEPFYFIVPLRKASSNKKINDIAIRSGKWKKTLLNSIYMNYRRSPYYDEVFFLVESIVATDTASISELNKTCILQVARFLGIGTEIVANPNFYELEARLSTTPEAELGGYFPHLRLEQPSVKLFRVLDICMTTRANVFVNPIGGASLYPKSVFKDNGIEVRYLKMRNIKYRQLCAKSESAEKFSPSLSIIDVLMNCGREETARLLEEFDFH